MKQMLVLLILGAASLSAQETRIEEVGKNPVEAKFAAGGHIRMSLCSSGTTIIGRDEPGIRVSMNPDREDFKVRMRIDGNRADLKVTGCGHNNFQVRIEIPKSSGLYVRMMAGQLDMQDVTGDKDVELSFGQLNLDVGKAEEYARVDASVNTGEISASAFNVEKGGLFRSFDQKGPGTYRLHAHVGAGEVDLR